MEYQHHNDDRFAKAQNNNGVHHFITMGNYDQALHHFRQALANKLAVENQLLLSTTTTPPQNQPLVMNNPIGHDESIHEESQQRCVTPELPDSNTTNSCHMELDTNGKKKI
jgi:hypothetical protein